MCGIAGGLDLAGGRVEPELIGGMCDCLRHRGPDDEGIFAADGVVLGQRRLSIVDLSTGHQPMSNEDGTVWVTFNGEIYNFRDLRNQLQRAGHRFVTESDTEVIVHAYEEDGPDCLRRFRGMFAFALWDARRQSLLLARDRVGKKPLFYAYVGGQLLFASELQGMLAHPAVRRDIDPTAIDDFLSYGYVPAPKTAFKGIYKLLPGHYLWAQRGGLTELQQYWQLSYEPKLALSESEAAEGLMQVLREATKVRLHADVPLGALLSGGIDSGVVVALASRLADRPVKTFSIGFDEPDHDELAHAREVAERYETDHHELIVRPDALDVLPTLVRHYGEPFADPSTVPTYFVARLTREHVTVALNGDGGDECFAGYQRYLAGVLADRYCRLPSTLRSRLIQPLAERALARLPQARPIHQARSVLEVAALPAAARYMRWVTYFSPQRKAELYQPDYQEELHGYDGSDWLRRRFEAAECLSLMPLDAMLHTDVHSYLSNDLLVKMDIAAMANSLEARSPFLDHEVMEFAARLPVHYKIRGMTQKYLLKQLGRPLLPERTVRRSKMGFGAPIHRWLRYELHPLLEDVLMSPEACQRGYFLPSTVRRLIDEHVAGAEDNSFQLWALLWLELWQRDVAHAADGRSTPQPLTSLPVEVVAARQAAEAQEGVTGRYVGQ